MAPVQRIRRRQAWRDCERLDQNTFLGISRPEAKQHVDMTSSQKLSPSRPVWLEKWEVNSKQSGSLASESKAAFSPSLSSSPSSSSSISPAFLQGLGQETKEEHGFLPVYRQNEDAPKNIGDQPHFYLLLDDEDAEDGDHGSFVHQRHRLSSHGRNQSRKHLLPQTQRTSTSFYSLLSYTFATGLLASSHSSPSQVHAQFAHQTIVCNKDSNILDAVALRHGEYILAPIIVLLGMSVFAVLLIALVEVMDRLWRRSMTLDEEQANEDEGEVEACNQDGTTAHPTESDPDDKSPPPYSLRAQDRSLSTRKQETKVLVSPALYSIPENQSIGPDAQGVVRHIHVYELGDGNSNERDRLMEEEETSDSASFAEPDSDDDYLDSFPIL